MGILFLYLYILKRFISNIGFRKIVYSVCEGMNDNGLFHFDVLNLRFLRQTPKGCMKNP